MMRLVLILSALHFVLMWIALLSGLSFMDMDGSEPTALSSAISSVASSCAFVLMQPGALLWTTWASHNLPDVFEWALTIINSLVWGAVLALVWTWLRRRNRPA